MTLTLSCFNQKSHTPTKAFASNFGGDLNSGAGNNGKNMEDGQHKQPKSRPISRSAQSWATMDRRGAVGLASSLAFLALGGGVGSQPVSSSIIIAISVCMYVLAIVGREQ